MKTGWILVTSIAALILYAPTEARAFECPSHISEARATIDKVSGELKSAMSRIPADNTEMVHSLLDYAEMFLAGAKHNHDDAQGLRDHVRAIAKADSALGYARAAERMLARIDKN